MKKNLTIPPSSSNDSAVRRWWGNLDSNQKWPVPKTGVFTLFSEIPPKDHTNYLSKNILREGSHKRRGHHPRIPVLR